MHRRLLVAGLVAGVAVVVLLTQPGNARRAALGAAPHVVRPAPRRAVPRLLIGRSVRGRPIVAHELGNPSAPRKILVVGCIHGNERAGFGVVEWLRAHARARNADLWVIPDLNPDGAAAGSRQNAHGVDLNRNFPFAWRPLGRRGDQQWSGPHPLSEPEARAARAFILRLRPSVTVWFHQPLGVVDESGGSVAIERRFARVAGLPLRRLIRYPGSVASWQDHRLLDSTAFVVELGPGRPSPAPAGRAVLDLLTPLPRARG